MLSKSLHSNSNSKNVTQYYMAVDAVGSVISRPFGLFKFRITTRPQPLDYPIRHSIK
jgi:hypothetical protein